MFAQNSLRPAAQKSYLRVNTWALKHIIVGDLNWFTIYEKNGP